MKQLDNLTKEINKILFSWVKKDYVYIYLNAPIYNDTCGGMTMYSKSADNEESDLDFDWDEIEECNRLIINIRDSILKDTGKRIWGLTYTLYADGKHEIEYDYNVPEGFNEQGEWIGEEHKNEAVSEFLDNIQKIGTDEFELK